MSQCDKFMKWFSAYMEDELVAAKRTLLEAHLQSCEACRSRFKGITALHQDLHQLAQPKTSANFETVLRYRLRREQPVRRWFILPSFENIWRAPAYAFAALVLIFLGAQIQKTMMIKQSDQLDPISYTLLNSANQNGHVIAAEFDSLQNRIKLVNLGNVQNNGKAQTIYLTDEQFLQLQRTVMPDLRSAPRTAQSAYSTDRSPRNQAGIVRPIQYQF